MRGFLPPQLAGMLYLKRESESRYVVTAHLFDRIWADARSRCRAEQFDHDVLHRLQRIRIAGTHDWPATLSKHLSAISSLLGCRPNRNAWKQTFWISA